jgi:hypothetical protein
MVRLTKWSGSVHTLLLFSKPTLDMIEKTALTLSVHTLTITVKEDKEQNMQSHDKTHVTQSVAILSSSGTSTITGTIKQLFCVSSGILCS